MTEATYFLRVNSDSSCKDVEEIPAEDVQTLLDAMRKALLRLVTETRAGSLRERIVIASYWENGFVGGELWLAGFPEPRRYRPSMSPVASNPDNPEPKLMFTRRYLPTNELEPLFEITGSYKDAYIAWPAYDIAQAYNSTLGNDGMAITEDDILTVRDALESICKEKQAEQDERYGNDHR